MIKEIWAQVVTTNCPHCKHKSPAVKRDGFTKLFVKPLAARNALVAKQSKALTKERSKSKDSTRSTGTEARSTASTAAGQRKGSAATEPDQLSQDSDEEMNDADEVDEKEESSEEEYKEGGSQKYISPIEVQDHIRRLWSKEIELLGLMYGRFDRHAPFRTDTSGNK